MSNVRRDMKCSTVQFHFPLRIGTFGWNKTVELNLPASKQDCKHFYGEYYVFLSCLGLCEEAVCPITRPVMWNSCPGQFNKRKIFTVDREGHLTFLMKDHDLKRAGSDLYLCENTNCVSYDKVCNLEDDCGDFSDEWVCVNHFKCNASGEYLPIVQRCDGTIHCSDKSDECNESCGRDVVSSSFLKAVGWIIGAAAVVLNCVSLFNGVTSLRRCESEPALLNKALVMLVGVGDLLIGVYLVVISISDAHHSENFCNLQLSWLSSDTCVALGVISTLGTQLSLLSMTSLSSLRVSGITKTLSVPKEKNKKSWMKLAAIVGVTMLTSSAISVIPLIKIFEDFFVNGLKYEDSNSLFIGCPGKAMHMNVLQAYYGRIMADYLTWSQIGVLVNQMFSVDYGGISWTHLSFYGNDPTCLFKYFIRREDPQENFVFAVLCLNFICFVVITCSYVTIVIETKRSAKRLQEMNSKNTAANNLIKKRNAQLERVTQWIIFTDFVCWVPFILICCLHYIDLLDATPWYPFFSLLVLPINSVINPLLYDVSLRQSLHSFCNGLKCKVKTFYHITFTSPNDVGGSNNCASVNRAKDLKPIVRSTANGRKKKTSVSMNQQSNLTKTREQSREEIDIQEQVQELPREEIEIQEQVQELPREEIEIQEQVQELPRKEIEIQEQVQELPREEVEIQEQVQELPREEIEIQEQVQELPREEIEIQEQVQELPREEIEIQEQVQELPREKIQEQVQETSGGDRDTGTSSGATSGDRDTGDTSRGTSSGATSGDLGRRGDRDTGTSSGATSGGDRDTGTSSGATSEEIEIQEQVQELPREEIEIQEQVQELPREEIEIQEQVQDLPREEIEIQEQVQELPREEIEIKEQVQEPPREEVEIQEQVQEPPREEVEIQEQVQELPREEIEIQEQVQELPREEIEIQEQVQELGDRDTKSGYLGDRNTGTSSGAPSGGDRDTGTSSGATSGGDRGTSSLPREEIEIQEQVQELPREEIEIQEQVQELPREEIEIQEQVQELPREEEIHEQVQELPREEIEIQEQVQELPREEIEIQEQVQELPWEEIEIQEQVHELPREEIEIQEQVQDHAVACSCWERFPTGPEACHHA